MKVSNVKREEYLSKNIALILGNRQVGRWANITFKQGVLFYFQEDAWTCLMSVVSLALL
jgi:hypothetical protein